MATERYSLLDAAARAWVQEDRSAIYEWARKGIRMDASSPIQGRYEVENSPQFKEVFDAFQDDDVRMITTIGPNQGGRTKAMEIASLWSIVNRPGPMQWNTSKDESAREFAEQRWWQSAHSCKEVVAKLPAGGTGMGRDRHKEKIKSVIFTDGMPFKIQGCAPANLEEKSVMTQFNDECWQWPVGRLEVAHIRCNVAYAWNYKIWNGSVAGIEGDDLDMLFRGGTAKEWHWTCLKCGGAILPRWGKLGQRGGIKWEKDRNTKPGKDWDYIEVQKTVRYECPHCDHDYVDSARNRRTLNESARYISLNPKAPSQFQSFRFNILSVNWPGLTWGRWVTEFLKAVSQMHRYSNLEPLKTFWTRRMAESWDESRHATTTHRIVVSDYTLGQEQYRWERETIRFLSVDKQEWGYPYVIRAVAATGDSRLIGAGVGERNCLTSYTEVDLKAKEYHVEAHRVLIDSSFETREVYAQAAKHGWTCMRGVDRDTLFRHMQEIVDPASKQLKRIAIELPYSELQWCDPFTGTKLQQINARMRLRAPMPQLARRFDWINLHIKNLLNAFKQGQAVSWGIPGNIDPEYLRQMNAEVRHAVLNVRGRRTEWWSNRTAKGEGHPRPNHAWDCECQVVVAMCLQKLIDLSDWRPEEGTEETEAA